jgi:glutaredoxin
MFYGETCVHCAQEEQWLAGLVRANPDIELHSYEVYYNPQNADMFKDFTAAYDSEETGVPTTFVGNHMIVGFSDPLSREIRKAIEAERSAPTIDPLERYHFYKSTGNALPHDNRLAAPLLAGALGTLAVTMGVLDGLNPCAFFVLLFLLSVLVRAGDRWRMVFIGTLFVLVSGAMYFLFMAAWLNAFAVVASLRWATICAGVIALAIGVINAKDGLLFRRGISLGVSEANRTRLVGQMYKLVSRTSFVSIAGATIVLAGMASLYQIVCTVGVPMAFVRILTTRNLTQPSYYGYLGLYCLAYIVPLAAVAVISSVAFSAQKMSDKLGKQLKLFSGVMMLSMGVVFLFAPAAIAYPIRLVEILAADVVITALVTLLVRMAKGKSHGKSDKPQGEGRAIV